MERKMFYGAKKHTFLKAKELRDNMTEAELKLWEILNKKQIKGYRFKAQHPIDIFIVDFYCHPLKLVIEVDGGIHLTKDQKEYDLGRTEELKQFGLEVIRFTNDQVLNSIDKVKVEIIKQVSNREKEIKSP
jgi:very-short-patch-repair endonuclease